MTLTQAEKDAHKLMRRGTRACRECRRRKIRCIWEDGKTDVCQECALHKRQCVKQGIVRGKGNTGIDSTSNVKVQVTMLESAVEKLAREKEKKYQQRIGLTPQELHDEDVPDTFFMKMQWKEHSPIYSLFDNEIIAQDAALPTHGLDTITQVQFLGTDLPDRTKLLKTIEHVPDILQVLDHAHDWWIGWREQHFALRKAAASLSLRDFVQQKLAKESAVEVALGLLAIAMALTQLRIGIDDSAITLPMPADQIMNQILAAVDQIICDSEQYKTDEEIIILLLMRAKHHVENNQLRKGWLRIRQAIRSAQATGFGMANPASGTLTDVEAERQRFIASIFEVDHLISMVLGFPYAKDASFTDARAFSVLLNTAIKDEELRMRALRRVVTVAAGSINDRNASRDIDDNVTESIQATLDMAASCMPLGWWSLVSQPLSGIARHRYESILVQTWFWVVQSYLHMPYVIKPGRSAAARRFRHLGMEAARNLIRTFNYLRMEPVASMYLCNCDDFQALLGACILLVGSIQSLSEGSDSPSGRANDKADLTDVNGSIEADLALIEELKDIFQYRMTCQGGGISKQGYTVLEELTSLLYEEDVEKVSDPNFKGDLLAFEINLSKRQKTIMLPYFGTIKIELTKKLPKRRTTAGNQNVVLTPPRSINGSLSGNSADAVFSTEYPSTIATGQSPISQKQFYSDVNYAPPMKQPYTSDDPLSFLNMGPTDQAVDNMQMPSISWDQWENFMYDQELDKDWNPGLQWDSNPLLYQ